MISFRAIGLIVCLSDSAGGRDPLVAYAGMSRVNAGPYGAAQDARMDAIRGPADSHGDFAPRGAPVGGRLKRAMDIALAGASLALLAPMFLLIAVLLHVGFGRPVFMARQRVGFAGRRFTAYTFSTAPTDAASQLATCVVGLLRDSGLDRLPELISVLRGDMSFVGPQPIQVGHPGPYRRDYLAARPGLICVFRTSRQGRWQVIATTAGAPRWIATMCAAGPSGSTLLRLRAASETRAEYRLKPTEKAVSAPARRN